ncbi:cardiolipin synthase [Halonatronum saccharophilum]|uniref:cardiolipin synthase n=1 Tax=Halonatronum saccharophilum TaxID=150060 RepID=UPI00146FB8D4|nr:cardiolipin synthase [Halonatronum saccharophilum]
MTKSIFVAYLFKGLALFLILFFIFNTYNIITNKDRLWGNSQESREYLDQLIKVSGIDLEEFEGGKKGVSKLIQKRANFYPTYGNKVTLIEEEENVFDDIFEAISNAKDSIHLEFYIIRDDRIGKRLKSLLIDKVNEGVEVRVIYDSLGSHNLKSEYKKKLKAAGVQLKAFNPPLKALLKGSLNYRNHRKLVIVDGETAFIGDANIGDEFVESLENIPFKKSLQLKIEGLAVNWMQKVFLMDWYFITGEKLDDKKYFYSGEELGEAKVQIVPSGYQRDGNIMNETYFSLINEAQERIYITTPYLILKDGIIQSLRLASLRGIEVNLIVSKNTDLFLFDWSNRSNFGPLLEAGVDIYKYENGLLHAKALVIDDSISSIGSTNFNSRSQFLDYEVNVIVFDKDLSKHIDEFLEELKEKSSKLTLEEYKSSSVLVKIKEKIGRIIIPLI